MFFPRINYSTFIYLSCAVFLAVGIGMLFTPPSFLPDFIKHPVFFSLTSVFAPLIVWLPKRILSAKGEREQLSITHIQVGICLAFLMNGAGELGLFELYHYGIPYDKIAHLLVPALITYILCENLFIRTRWSRKFIISFGIITVFLVGILWEIFEALLDIIFNTQVWGINGKHIAEDTVIDIFFNTTGILLASLIFWRQSKHVDRTGGDK